ncbi:MAG: biopolymer transporter ExbD [Planctomycetaceae bacterium]|nr:biopolymer transporter ExbD [Planctomycetaceae bacterium]
MPIKYRCSNCRQLLSVSRKQTGKEFPCPRCGAQTRVPAIPPEFGGPPDDPSNPRITAIPEPTAKPETTEKAKSEKAKPSPPPIPSNSPELPSKEKPSAEKSSAVESAGKQQDVPESPPAAGDHSPHSQIVMSAEVGPFKVKKRLMDEDGMDLTPMVDVTFLLLIFFMITASFSMQKTLEFPKPNPQDKGARQTLTIENLQNDSIMIKIDERNAITVDETPLAEPALLAEQLTQLRFSTRRTSVAIDAHKDSFHETVVAVIDASNAAGMENIKLISRSSGK